MPVKQRAPFLILALLGATCANPRATHKQTAPPRPQDNAQARPSADKPADNPAPAPEAEAPALRLPDAVVPVEHRAELTIDTSRDEFAGIIDIDIDIREQTQIIWLNATELSIKSASIRTGENSRPLRVLPGNDDFTGFSLNTPIPPGPATLHIEYTGRISSNDYSGIFKQEDDGNRYVYTQFEAIAARRAFPCFDEPRFKVPWQLTLHVNDTDQAFSNTPLLDKSPGPGEGQTTYRFARSKPLPSYLVALAVGPFEIVDLGAAGRNQTPTRILVPKGHRDEARYAAEITPELLALLEDYFDMPYPYAKLDSVVLPHFFGAMENPGLITYDASAILSPPDKETLRFKRRYASIAAHELAHQWFGNLVTLSWWNDIWLNESFATWMSSKIVSRWRPAWKAEIARANRAAGAMAADSLMSARRIRQPIKSKHDIFGAFDAISYSKGSAVLTMFEHWIGEDTFRRGVRAYMQKHAWSTATSEDFLAAIGEVSQEEVPAAFETFLNQPGVPLVSVELSCEPGQAPSLSLSQERLLPIGSEGSARQTWTFPVCIKYDAGRTTAEQCASLDQRSSTIALDKARSCPDWVLANADAAGYYRVVYPEDMVRALISARNRRVSQVERLAVVDDIKALVTTGTMRLGEALALVPAMIKNAGAHMLSRVAYVVASVDRNLISERLMPKYQRFVREMFSRRARRLGWSPAESESDDTRMLRHSLLDLVVRKGEDPALVERAVSLARQWLRDRSAVAPSLLGLVLETAAKHGDDDLYQRFVEALEQSRDRKERRALVRAVATTTDPTRLEKNFQLALSGTLSLREAGSLLQIPLANPKSRQLVYDHIKDNFDALLEKLPRHAGAFLIYSAGSFCDDAHYQDAQAFFGPKVDNIPGGPKALAQTLERIQLCIAFRAAQQPSVEAFLQRY